MLFPSLSFPCFQVLALLARHQLLLFLAASIAGKQQPKMVGRGIPSPLIKGNVTYWQRDASGKAHGYIRVLDAYISTPDGYPFEARDVSNLIWSTMHRSVLTRRTGLPRLPSLHRTGTPCYIRNKGRFSHEDRYRFHETLYRHSGKVRAADLSALSLHQAKGPVCRTQLRWPEGLPLR